MTLESDRRQRTKVAFLQLQNQIIAPLNTHVRPKDAERIALANVPESEKPFEDLLLPVKNHYVDLKAANVEPIEVPVFCYGRNRTIDPFSKNFHDLMLFLDRFRHRGYGWTCKKCGNGYEVNTKSCKKCNLHRDDQLEKLDQVTWKSDYVDVIAAHLKAVDKWWDDLDEGKAGPTNGECIVVTIASGDDSLVLKADGLVSIPIPTGYSEIFKLFATKVARGAVGEYVPYRLLNSVAKCTQSLEPDDDCKASNELRTCVFRLNKRIEAWGSPKDRNKWIIVSKNRGYLLNESVQWSVDPILHSDLLRRTDVFGLRTDPSKMERNTPDK